MASLAAAEPAVGMNARQNTTMLSAINFQTLIVFSSLDFIDTIIHAPTLSFC
jgi:hypothetical protein